MTAVGAMTVMGAHAEDHRGGTMRLLARSAAGSIDPQVNYTAQYWQMFAGAYDGLVAFRKVAGVAGREVVADLAEAVPVPVPVPEGGLVYRFRLRPGVRFSDGAAVRPADVAASFRRIFRVSSPTAQTFFGVIEGADECLAHPADCALPGVREEADGVTITLSRPDPEFLQKLALPHASVLPADAPPHDTGTVPIPGTGPYRLASYDASEALVLERNPFFREWSSAAQPDGYPDTIRYEFGLEAEAQVTSVLAGRADWMFDTPPADRLAEIGEVAGPRLHLSATPAIWYVPLNVNIPPFDDVRVRRALNMAVDRAAPVRLFGGSALAMPLCQAVPPDLPGYEPYCPYPHDPAAARRLVAESGRAGTPVTLVVDDSAVQQAVGTYLLDVLGDVGLPARLRTLSGNVQFPFIQNTANGVQASLTGWYADYPSAANILAGNFGCAAFHPNSDSSTNIAGFCDPALDARLLAGDVAAVDRGVTDAAPAVVLFAPRSIDLVSARVGGFLFHDSFRFLPHLAWVR